MRRLLCPIVLISIFSTLIFPVERIVLKNGEDYLEKLIENGIYFKFIKDVDYNEGFLYLLDYELSTVFVVDFSSGKLVRTIFRKGQGPNELMNPTCLTVKDQKVFVLDQGFNGIKIADVNGNPVNEFKTKGMVGQRNIDVNEKNEIYVGEYNSDTKTYVAVYNIKGEKLRALVQINPKEKLSLKRIHYNIRLDHEGNIVMIFNALNELKKFTANGEPIWECAIKNDILNMYHKPEIKSKRKGTLNTKICVLYHEITAHDNILISHCGGGCLFDKDGLLKYLIAPEKGYTLGEFEIINNKLISFLVFGRIVLLYDIKEEIK